MSSEAPGFEGVFRRTRAVFWAFLAAPFAYVGALFVLLALEYEPTFDEGATRNVVVGALAAMSAVQLASREYIARRTARQALARGESVWEAQATAEVMRMPLNESIAIYGIVIFVLTMQLWLALPFIIVGVVALYASRPQRDRWREAAKEDRT